MARVRGTQGGRWRELEERRVVMARVRGPQGG